MALELSLSNLGTLVRFGGTLSVDFPDGISLRVQLPDLLVRGKRARWTGCLEIEAPEAYAKVMVGAGKAHELVHEI